MIIGAAIGFAAAFTTGNAAVGIVAAILAGMALSALFALMTLGLAANQVAIGPRADDPRRRPLGPDRRELRRPAPRRRPGAPHRGLSDIPLVGPVVFGQDAIVYASLALVTGVSWFLYRTRAGLVLRAVGDNHGSAHALGYTVRLIRFGAVLFGGGCAGLAGAYLSLAYTPFWVNGHDRGPRLDRARPRGVRVLAAGAAPDRRLPLRRDLHRPAPSPGHPQRPSGLAGAAQPGLDGAPLPCDDRRSRCHIGIEGPRRRRAGLARGSPSCPTDDDLADRAVRPLARDELASGCKNRGPICRDSRSWPRLPRWRSGSAAPPAQDKLKVGFVYVGPVGDFG